MRRILLALSIFLLATTVDARGRHGHNGTTISIDDDDVTSCSDLNVSFDGDRVPVSSEEIPFRGSSLRVRTEHNGGGIQVTGWSGSTYGITLCRAVAPGIDASAIRATLNGNELSADGPDSEKWIAYFLIRAPRGATLDLASTNGPIGIADFNGTLTAEAVNGPIGIRDSSGKIDARTTNGPVSISGGSGDVKLNATNGPISVKLSGTTWDGNLDAATKNGPATLKIARGFRSGVLVEALGHGPVSCKAEGCPDLRKSWNDDDDDRPRQIELGSGPRTVRLSTYNGPVSVKEME